MILEGKQAVVTGGAGFIGSHLVDLLVEAGCRVRVLDDLSTGKAKNLDGHRSDPGFELVEGCVTDKDLVRRVLLGADVVFHLACLGVRHSLLHPLENHRVNAEGSLTVALAACERRVSLFVHCSSSEIYGTAETAPMTEEHPARPRTVYGAGKLAGEAVARALHYSRGLPAVIMRPFNAYGPRSHHEGLAGEVIPKTIVRAMHDEPPVIFGDGSQTRDFTYVTDTARALVEAARCDAVVGRTLNVGSGLEISIGHLAAKIVELVGGKGGPARNTPQRPGDVDRLCADTSKFAGLSGWGPRVGLDEGLALTVDWFRRHPSGIDWLAAEEVARSWEGAE